MGSDPPSGLTPHATTESSTREPGPSILRPSWSFIATLIVVEAAFAALVLGGIWAIWRAGRVETPDVPEVRALIAEQAEAWNRGDLDGFMAGYWNDERLTFASGPDVTRGWQATFNRYRKRYQEEGKSMGRLTFSDVEATPVDDGLATARGTWHVAFPDGNTASGRFVLVLRRYDSCWRIVYDHTTSFAP